MESEDYVDFGAKKARSLEPIEVTPYYSMDAGMTTCDRCGQMRFCFKNSEGTMTCDNCEYGEDEEEEY